MSRVPEELRHAAHDAWVAAGEDQRQAIKALKKVPAAAGYQRLGKIIHRWGAGFNARRGYQDRHRPGRPSSLSQLDLDRAVEILKGGFMFGCIPRAYPSFSYACDESEELRGILARAKISRKHLLVRIKTAAPGLVFRMQSVKAAFNAKQKKDRMRDCRWHIRKSDRYRLQTFYVDAKKMYVSASPVKAWLDGSEETDTIPDLRAETRTVLHFYAVVNACGGPVALMYVTGTTGLARQQPYLVRLTSSQQLSTMNPCSIQTIQWRGS